MGDRIVPSATFRRLLETHRAGPHEADLTLLSAVYEPSKVKGKGRILRDDSGRVVGILEQRDLDAMTDRTARRPCRCHHRSQLPALCRPRRHAAPLHPRPAQRQRASPVLLH